MKERDLSLKSGIKKVIDDFKRGDKKAARIISSLLGIAQDELQEASSSISFHGLKKIIKERHPYMCDTQGLLAFFKKVPIYYSYEETEIPYVGYKFERDCDMKHVVEVASKNKDKQLRDCNENDLYDENDKLLDCHNPSLILWKRKVVTKYVFERICYHQGV